MVADKHVPHGIRYSLLLHDRFNRRVLGFDNAYAIKPKRNTHKARKVTWDHTHQREQVTAYEFTSVSQLLEDFWGAVEEYLGEVT